MMGKRDRSDVDHGSDSPLSYSSGSRKPSAIKVCLQDEVRVGRQSGRKECRFRLMDS